MPKDSVILEKEVTAGTSKNGISLRESNRDPFRITQNPEFSLKSQEESKECKKVKFKWVR